MDESLFIKHINQIKKRSNNKIEIILYIKEKTGIEVEEENISIKKKEITLNISSTIKQRLFQFKIKEELEKKGFVLKV